MSQEIWNKICFLLSDNVRENVPEIEFEQQVLRAMEVLGWSEFGGEIRRQISIPVGRQGILRPDLVIYGEEGKALIVIEVKRPQEDISRDDSISQLKSYMRQMKADFGFLVGKEIRIYYDGERNPQADPFLIDKIPFKRTEKKGRSFAEMFIKENFLSDAYLNILNKKFEKFNFNKECKKLKDKLLSEDTKKKIFGFLKNEFADYGSDVFKSVMAQINISVEDISDQHTIQPADGIPTNRPQRRIISTPARPNSSISGNTYSLSELKNMVLGRENKPRALIIRDQTIEVSNWTELSIKFVECLIRSNLLNESRLPIYTYSEREKYFINSAPQHEIAEKDGQWNSVGNFFVDTKYNADGHKKNIIHTLEYLSIDDTNIKISFR